MARCLTKRSVALVPLSILVAARPRLAGVAAALRSALADRDPAPLARPGSDTEGGTHSMHAQANARGSAAAPVDGFIRTRYTLDVCELCGNERVRTPRAQTTCPQCGASARRSFALFRGLREVQR
jgi:hypothetical protein